jgi:hypothetical protein
MAGEAARLGAVTALRLPLPRRRQEGAVLPQHLRTKLGMDAAELRIPLPR